MTVIAMKDYQTGQLEQMELPQLAQLVNEKHQDAERATQTALERWAEVGEALIVAKAKVKHGEWGRWVKDNLSFSPGQAWKYMKLAQYPNLYSGRDLTSINAAVAMLAAEAPDDADSDKPSKPPRAPRRPAKPRGPSVERQRALDAYDRLKSEGKQPTQREVAKEAGVAFGTVNRALHAERPEVVAKLEPEPPEPPPLPELSMTAQQKVDAHIKRFEAEFEERVRQESMKWVNETRIPIYEKKIADLMRMFNWPRNAIMTKLEYIAIMKCLDPDALHSRTEEQLAEAFRIFTDYKPKLVPDDDPPQTLRRSYDLPLTREEMMSRLSPAQKRKWGIV